MAAFLKLSFGCRKDLMLLNSRMSKITSSPVETQLLAMLVRASLQLFLNISLPQSFLMWGGPLYLEFISRVMLFWNLQRKSGHQSQSTWTRHGIVSGWCACICLCVCLRERESKGRRFCSMIHWYCKDRSRVDDGSSSRPAIPSSFFPQK